MTDERLIRIAGNRVNSRQWKSVDSCQWGGANAVIEFESGHTDEQIGKRYSYSSCLVFAVELTVAKGNRHGDGIDGIAVRSSAIKFWRIAFL